MKKLIMFGLVAVAACAVNAASFSWNSTSVGTDGGGNPITSASDAATIVLVYLGNGASASIDNAVEVMEGSWDISTNKKTGATTAKVSGTYYGTGTGGFANGNVYTVMAKDSAGGLHQMAGVNTYTITDYSGDSWAGPTFQFASSNYIADKASYPAVPEPTSGILMLCGLGALALRRRRA